MAALKKLPGDPTLLRTSTQTKMLIHKLVFPLSADPTAACLRARIGTYVLRHLYALGPVGSKAYLCEGFS